MSAAADTKCVVTSGLLEPLRGNTSHQRPHEDVDDKPRHVYRIRKTDYVKLPPISKDTRRGACSRCEQMDTLLDNCQLHALERYVTDLLPGMRSRPNPLRTTMKSPVPITEREPGVGVGARRGLAQQNLGSLQTSLLCRFGHKALLETSDFNRDLLNKEVEIKRILEQHRPTLLRSLKDLYKRKVGALDRDKLEVEGVGGAGAASVTGGSSFLGRCSTLVDSALGDSAFGLWEGSHDHDDSTEYLPSQRTLVTCDQEKSFIHSILDEEELLIMEEPLSSSENGESLYETSSTSSHASSPKIKYTPRERRLSRRQSSRVLIAPDPVPEPPTAASPTPEPFEEVTSLEDSLLISSPEDVPIMQTPLEEVQETPTPKQETPAMATPRDPTPVAPAAVEPAAVEPAPVEPAPKELSPTHEDPETELKPEDIAVSVMTPGSMDESDEESEPFEPNPVADDDDILGINAMLAALDSDEEDLKSEESDDGGMEEGPVSASLGTESSEPASITPPVPYEYKPPPPKLESPPTDELTVTHSPSPAPLPSVSPPNLTAKEEKLPRKFAKPPKNPPFAKPPKPVGMNIIEKEKLRQMKEDAAAEQQAEKARAKQRSREREEELLKMEKLTPPEELAGNESVDEILHRFTIVDKARLNYLLKIFNEVVTNEEEPFLSHKEMKRALSQIKSCTKITRNQLKFIELLLGLNKQRISFHTFAVMATLIDHMTHRDPSTLAMFDSIDLTRLEHDLPRMKRLFHCVSERDDFGWPRLTTKAMDIELRAACVPEQTRNRLIKELDPKTKGEITIFDFILFTPLWMYLHDGIVDNPFNQLDREVVTPDHRKWGVSVLWMPENHHDTREPPASPASGCGSELTTPGILLESPRMRAVVGGSGYSDQDESEGIANSDDEND